ncbi:MoaD/ThiS family protein [Candidatus Woesearchaeota archaeon]|jgi:sulfur carrier protein ThiS|nr:MoaD/ThiS family protein [Candidatus Woesearchaeota archaeon]MBT3438379.1 MoaD/ThiS family protein [Candidatus Woesearchaeota archaeon]MBT4058366.1 MoaD/ThiS family protein [Candidatus Woesearchaeota archaeon]MBT4207612.1 MoaD/ThiS family protein [Candidatus Woesearchaeota archaeon]MBT4730625.1 MoaD/ThiS family protein [Candidatus Woesearchaeota archaeon]
MVKINVYIERDDVTKQVEISKKTTIKDILIQLNINPVTVIVTKNDELCDESEEINSKDKLKIISVVSGG